MFCNNCGVTLPDRDRFCSGCGTPTLSPLVASSAQPPPTQQHSLGKTIVIGFLLVMGFIIAIVMFGPSSTSTGSADGKTVAAFSEVVLPSGTFSDDADTILSNLHVYDSYVKVYSDMLDARIRLGNPNAGPISIPDSSCPSQPQIIVLYKDMLADEGSKPFGERKTYILQYENLHCQPDQRAYVLIGIHPVPGQWSNALLSQGVVLQEH
jgi:hypothetical protein